MNFREILYVGSQIYNCSDVGIHRYRACSFSYTALTVKCMWESSKHICCVFCQTVDVQLMIFVTATNVVWKRFILNFSLFLENEEKKRRQLNCNIMCVVFAHSMCNYFVNRAHYTSILYGPRVCKPVNNFKLK